MFNTNPSLSDFTLVEKGDFIGVFQAHHGTPQVAIPSYPKNDEPIEKKTWDEHMRTMKSHRENDEPRTE